MYLFILITGIVLFPEAQTLKCYECLDGTGSCGENQKLCSADTTRCGALGITSFNGNSKVSDFKTKTCLKAEQCIQGSVNFGVSRTVMTSKCCDSDLCNTQYAPEPPKANPNGKKCYRCDGQADCTGTLNCDGDEDHCVSASVTVGSQKINMKGCATRSFCLADNTANLQGIGKLTCCQGNYCNSSSSTSASFLLLVTMLTSFLFFSN